MKERVSVEDMESIRNHPAHHITATINYQGIEKITARAEATDAEWPVLLNGKLLGMHVDMIMCASKPSIMALQQSATHLQALSYIVQLNPRDRMPRRISAAM